MTDFHSEHDDDDVGCECELDWSCAIHRGQPTPEDRIATAWSQATR